MDKANPSHYKRYTKETIDIMKDGFGVEKTKAYCELSAFKYRMRMGTKKGETFEDDLKKEQWYLHKLKQLDV